MRRALVRHWLILIVAVSTPLVLAGIVVVASGEGSAPVAAEPAAKTAVVVTGVPEVDYVIDLDTSVMTPLPEAIVRSAGSSGGNGHHEPPGASSYAVSPDGFQLAYVGIGEGGSEQIFIAGIDGTRVRQVTHDAFGSESPAWSPAWSPDGTSIAYVGYRRDGGDTGAVANLFLLDIATGAAKQMTAETSDVSGPQFTPEGSSLLYTSGSGDSPELRTVLVVSPGKSTRLIGPDRDLHDARNGSLSPDGSLVTFLGSSAPRSRRLPHCGPCRWVANADGTNKRVLAESRDRSAELGCYESNPAGTWSPDGRRIVCSQRHRILVTDVVTGRTTYVAEGSQAIWLDQHKLLVKV